MTEEPKQKRARTHLLRVELTLLSTASLAELRTSLAQGNLFVETHEHGKLRVVGGYVTKAVGA